MIPFLVALSFLAPEPEPHPRILHAAIASYVVSQNVDATVTMYGIGRGDFREGNPLLRWAEDRPVGMALTKGAIAVTTSAILIKLHKDRPKTTLILTVALTALQTYAVVRNARQLR